jgi:beta-phosphoglucomutase-like phosphatase (HAD superfamily)
VTIKALIFDFDGLLVDTESAILLAWQEMFRESGNELPLDVWHSVVGTQHTATTMLALLAEFGPPDPETTRLRFRTRVNELVGLEGPRDGVPEYLKDATALGLRMAVASSASGEWVKAQLLRAGLADYFEAVLTGDLHPAKPRPDLYLAALAALDVTADEALAFEDSPHGVTAAKAAGLRCVAVPNPVTAQLTFTHADLVLPSFTHTPLSNLLAASAPGESVDIFPGEG